MTTLLQTHLGGHIGDDPWRNLLAVEASVLQRQHGTTKASVLKNPPGHSTHRARTVVSCQPPRTPRVTQIPAFGWRWVSARRHTVEVAISGRRFICEPTRDDISNLAPSSNRLLVIALNWTTETVAGLQALIDTQRPLTVITSWWMWEELLPHLNGRSFEHRTVADLETDSGHEESMALVLGFDERLCLPLGLGTYLHMAYVPSPVPSLSARFQCNGQEIAVDRVSEPRFEPRMLRELVWEEIRIYPALYEAFHRRYGELNFTEDDRSLSVIQLPAPVNGRIKTHGRLFIPKAGGGATWRASTHSCAIADILRTTIFAIFCAGVNLAREAVDPGRRLTVPMPGERRSEVTSVLHWRLTELAALGAGNDERLAVCLVVSADTETLVRREVARLPWELRERLDITLLRQQLMPCLEATEQTDQSASTVGTGWELQPPGHLDLLLLLQHFEGLRRGYRRCMAFAHNNLGTLLLQPNGTANLHPETQKVLSELDDVFAAVELFQLEPKIASNSQYDWLSFVPRSHPDRLVKRYYYREPVEALTPEAFSSHTWYFNLEKLDNVPKHVFDEYILRNDFPRQELEQLTHTNLPIWFLHHPRPSSGDGFYAHDRFLIAPTEDDIRSQAFQEAFQRAHGHSESRTLSLVDPVVVLSPVESRNIWGGYRIRSRKELPHDRVGESWELSTHSGGTTMIHRSIGESVPLTEVLRAQNDGDPHLPYMVKYLDCELPLSVQIHPSPAVTNALLALKRNLDAPPITLADGGSKEESFFVIEPAETAPGEQAKHLLLGLNPNGLDDLTGMARKVAQAMRPMELLIPAVQQKLGTILHEAKIDAACTYDGNRVKAVERVVQFHRERCDRIEDLERVIAALAMVWAIWELAANRLPDDVRTRRLFSDREGPLLRHFCYVPVERNQWVRIPPGMMHAWQGGGNVLVELSHRSDNTFRILDLGRELRPGTRRKMHYIEAMYALEACSVLDKNRIEGYLLPPTLEPVDCHELLSARLFVAQADQRRFHLCPRGEISFVLNPDGPTRLRSEGEVIREVSLGSCRSALLSPNTPVSAVMSHAGDRLLHVWPKKK